jgi:hypothetical protein
VPIATPAAWRPPAVNALLALAPVWIAAGAVAWTCFRVAGGPEARGLVRWGLWLAAVALAVLLGWTVGCRIRQEADRRTVAVAVGWAIAVAAGWFLDVQVGGPVMGMVTAVVLGAAAGVDGYPWFRIAVALAIGLIGTAAGLQLSGGRGTPLGLLGAVLGGLAAVFGAAAVLRIVVARGEIALLTLLWGAAWYLAWTVTAALLPASLGMFAVLGAEVALAVMLGGIATGVVRGWPFLATTAAALAGAAVAVSASWAVDALLTRVLPAALVTGSGRETYLDVGNVAGLYLAAAIIVGPFLRIPRPVPE